MKKHILHTIEAKFNYTNLIIRWWKTFKQIGALCSCRPSKVTYIVISSIFSMTKSLRMNDIVLKMLKKEIKIVLL